MPGPCCVAMAVTLIQAICKTNQSGNMDRRDSCPTPVAQHVDLLSARKMIHSIESCASQWGLKRNAGNNYNHSSGPSPDMVLSTFPIFAHLIPMTTLRSRYYFGSQGTEAQRGQAMCPRPHSKWWSWNLNTHHLVQKATLQTIALPCLLSHKVKQASFKGKMLA